MFNNLVVQDVVAGDNGRPSWRNDSIANETRRMIV
jgi:hypothetical protein